MSLDLAAIRLRAQAASPAVADDVDMLIARLRELEKRLNPAVECPSCIGSGRVHFQVDEEYGVPVYDCETCTCCVGSGRLEARA